MRCHLIIVTTFLPLLQWNIWMYQDMYLNGFFNGQHYCFVLHWPGDDTTGMDSRWDLSLAPDAMNMHAMGVPNPACVCFNMHLLSLAHDLLDSLLRLASLIESATPLPELDYEPLESWVHEDSKVLLVGDAAAPFPIPGLYSVSVGFEDAEVLGALLGRVRKVENIPALLAAYDELRPDRAADLAKRERNQVAGWQQLTSQGAPSQHALATNGDVDEDEVALRKFEEYLQVVGYAIVCNTRVVPLTDDVTQLRVRHRCPLRLLRGRVRLAAAIPEPSGGLRR
jgi:hypothetical protein